MPQHFEIHSEVGAILLTHKGASYLLSSQISLKELLQHVKLNQLNTSRFGKESLQILDSVKASQMLISGESLSIIGQRHLDIYLP